MGKTVFHYIRVLQMFSGWGPHHLFYTLHTKKVSFILGHRWAVIGILSLLNPLQKPGWLWFVYVCAKMMQFPHHDHSIAMLKNQHGETQFFFYQWGMINIEYLWIKAYVLRLMVQVTDKVLARVTPLWPCGKECGGQNYINFPTAFPKYTLSCCGPDKILWCPGCGPQALVWRPLHYMPMVLPVNPFSKRFL